MHSFEVNIRICQPENSYIHRGEAGANITFLIFATLLTLTLFASLFLVLYKVFLYL